MKLSWGSFFAMDTGENWIGFRFGDSITIRNWFYLPPHLSIE
ncbi:MAG: hypothetical protein ACI35J_10325 [Peribacillus sp.]